MNAWIRARMQVPCPTCRVPAGQRCRPVKGGSYYVWGKFHSARTQAVLDARADAPTSGAIQETEKSA
jgi:hypothetical protein